VALVAGCSGDRPDARDEVALGHDADALREALLADPALPVLVEVRRVVEDDLPVRASEILEQVAIPAARRQVETLAACRVETAEGEALRRRAEEAYQARLSALRDYQRALARGPLEDMVLLEAVRSLRASEEALAEVHVAVEALGGAPPTGSGDPPPTR